jgi:Uri superfamily endonuclease
MFFIHNNHLAQVTARWESREHVKGVYVLVLDLGKDTSVCIGALGAKAFQKGKYLYVGSAQNNLDLRVQRHLKKEKRLFWHIDYLLDHEATAIVKVFYKLADKAEECRLANEISKHGTAIDGFGCSDCHCKSHLFLVKKDEFLLDSMQPFVYLASRAVKNCI